MKESVWYHAGYDNILVRVARNRIELGCQGSNTVTYAGKTIQVPDWLNLFTWKINLKTWSRHRKKGWLIPLGVL